MGQSLRLARFPSPQEISKLSQENKFPVTRRFHWIHCVIALVFTFVTGLYIHDILELYDKFNKSCRAQPVWFVLTGSIELQCIMCRLIEDCSSQFNRKLFNVFRLDYSWTQPMRLFKRHNSLQVKKVYYMLELCCTTFRGQVGTHWWTLESFSGMKIVVDILYVMDRIEDEENWLSSGRIDYACLELAIAEVINKEFSVCCCIVHRDGDNIQTNTSQKNHDLIIALELFCCS